MTTHNQPDRFIVCGLGSLGQQVVVNLNKFSQVPNEIAIAAIDLVKPPYWEIEEFPHLLSAPVIVGDSRQRSVLLQAEIERCRSILIVTSDESVNVETALVARRLNPTVHIVLRSSRYNLNDLLKRQLGNFVALDAMELPANTFALTAMSGAMLSVFKVENHSFQVVQRSVTVGEPRYDRVTLQQLSRRRERLLDFSPSQPLPPSAQATTASKLFHRWQPDVVTGAGDVITTIELDESPMRKETPTTGSLWVRLSQGWKEFAKNGWHQQLFQFWRRREQRSLRRVTLIALFAVLIFWPTGTLLIKQAIPGMGWGRAIALGVILLLGGYGDVYGGLEGVELPIWLPLVSLAIALASLFLVISAFSLLADQLLSSRFDFLRRRPRMPKENHIIVVGIGRLGYRAIKILREFKQPLIGITHQLPYPELASEMPLLEGNILQQLKQANLSTAKSVLATTDDPMLNLEIALIVSEAAAAGGNAESFTPIIRTVNRTLSDNVAVLLPQSKAFSVYALSAEAFAGAAFGENILSLFRLQKQTILVTEYQVEESDHLCGKLLAEVAYGYGVVPFLLKTRGLQGEWQELPMPRDELRLQEGDRLHVLSSINGLRRIERGAMVAPLHWRLKLGKPLNPQILLVAGNTLTQLSGRDIAWCRRVMDQLPTTVELSLYEYQAARLRTELQRYIPTELSKL